MPIQVVCSSCKARFSVSDQYAGRTGPCPKCKKPITIPATPVQKVTIHEPEAPVTSSAGTGRTPTAPIRRVEKPISQSVVIASVAGTLATVLATGLSRWAWGPGHLPIWLLATGAIGLSLPCVRLGYALMREKELEPYRGRSLLVRVTICAAVYAFLWGVKSFVPPEMTAEMWQWVYIAPLFFGAGALAALATLDLDWSAGVAHYSLYVIVTALLRWLAGFAPV